MQFAAALSTTADTAAAVREACGSAREQLDGPIDVILDELRDSETQGSDDEQLDGPIDLALAFVSHHHGPEFDSLARAICAELGTENLLGCTGESIVGGDREIEGQPALSVWLARLPGVDVSLMHLEFEQTPDGGTFIGWPEAPDDDPAGPGTLLLLGEPFTFPADALLTRLNEDRPDLTVVGGMASGGWSPGTNRLLLGMRAPQSGAVAAMLRGPLRVRTVVSQGCSPIGRPLVVTKARENVILELGGKPPLEQLRSLWPTLSPREQEFGQGGLYVGQVIDARKDRFDRGDFLVRNVLGADPQNGAVAIGALVRPGQTVQFHVRDSRTADEDLRELLGAARAGGAPSAALLFTCNGRGTRLFDEPHHDASVLRSTLGEIPLAGFFAQGEIGPIGGKTFVHGFTASVALFEAMP